MYLGASLKSPASQQKRVAPGCSAGFLGTGVCSANVLTGILDVTAHGTNMQPVVGMECSAGPRRMQQAPKGLFFCTVFTVPVFSGLEEAVVGKRGLTCGTGSCMT